MCAAAVRSLCFSLLLLPIGVAIADESGQRSPAVPWQDTLIARLDVLALLQTLNAELLSHDSATLTLDRWCAVRHLATPAKIVAERVRDADKQPTREQRELLRAKTTEPVQYRRVRLRCGERVLSEADNWYVPGRLTPEMNQTLDTSDMAFGRAVQALQFHRRTLSATLLWSPLPEGWEMAASALRDSSRTLDIPPQVLEHKAVLALPDGTPFSHVVETYTSEVLGFP